jgi:hypothetical protein
MAQGGAAINARRVDLNQWGFRRSALGWAMAEDAATLRRRIALYREYLRSGLDIDLARLYLDEIIRAERTLSELKGRVMNVPQC